MNGTAQEHFQTLIDSFRLAVCLWMVCRGQMQFGAQKLEQFLPKLAGKDFVTVANNGHWQTVQLDHVVHECNSH